MSDPDAAFDANISAGINARNRSAAQPTDLDGSGAVEYLGGDPEMVVTSTGHNSTDTPGQSGPFSPVNVNDAPGTGGGDPVGQFLGVENLDGIGQA